MIKLKTIHSKIFFYYATLIAAIILIFLSSFSIYITSILRKNASDSLSQLSLTIQNNLDLELKNLSTIALKTISSEQIRKAFFDDTDSFNSRLSNDKSLADLILSIEGPTRSLHKLTLYRNDGLCYEYGITNSFFNSDIKEIKTRNWAVQTLKLEGKRLITSTHLEQDGALSKPIISLCQSFAEIYGMKPDNLIEIQQDYKVFANIIEKYFAFPDNQAQYKLVYIFDKAGNIIFPYSENAIPSHDKAEFCWNTVKNLSPTTRNQIIRDPVNAENIICAYTRSDFSGWTTLLLEPEEVLVAPVKIFVKNVLIVGIVILFITLLISYFVSRSLTVPIKKIRNSIKKLDLDSLDVSRNSLPLNSDIDELQELNSTFFDMQKRLKESLDEAISARSHEIQSRLLALQSQMNPHFLYNSLSFISITCEEQGIGEVVQFCKGLSSMLRYISSDSFEHVTLGQEIEHTRNYLHLVERRYGGMLKFEIDIPETLLEEKVPKLIIQPLVENSIKYGMGNEAPWIIKVKGYLLQGQWLIAVSDNGTGFEYEKLESIKQKLLQVDALKEMPSLKLSGMGLINIYTRLRLFYEDTMVFKIENLESGGALITIGGPADSRRMDIHG